MPFCPAREPRQQPAQVLQRNFAFFTTQHITWVFHPRALLRDQRLHIESHFRQPIETRIDRAHFVQFDHVQLALGCLAARLAVGLFCLTFFGRFVGRFVIVGNTQLFSARLLFVQELLRAPSSTEPVFARPR